MSIWTHIAGCIRIDSMKCHHGIASELAKILKAVEKDIPIGSEGALTYDVIKNPDEYMVAKYYIALHGDLRDYDSSKEIEVKLWWDKLIKKIGKNNIRQAVLQVNFEDMKDSIIYSKRTW